MVEDDQDGGSGDGQEDGSGSGSGDYDYMEEEGGSVHVLTSAAEWARLHPRLCRDLALVPVLGLDCEWVGAGPVSLLQLATFSGLCILVRSVEEYFES